MKVIKSIRFSDVDYDDLVVIARSLGLTKQELIKTAFSFYRKVYRDWQKKEREAQKEEA